MVTKSPGPPGAPPAAAAAPPPCAPFKLAVQEDVYTTVFNHGPLKVLCSGVLVCVVLPYLGTDTIVIHYIKIPIDHFVVCLGLIVIVQY